jgi:site-specific DNA-methyltransferase (cytosine-N4-specific)
MFLCLSNVLRRVSWQKNDDLRVRRESKKAGNIDPLKEFLDELDRSTKLMLAFLRQEYSLPIGTADIEQGDSRQLAKYWHRWRGKVNAVITSPPYATALPYLDTDRLSLCFLGLLTRPEHRNHDYQMIGNREISEKARKELWQAFCSYTRTLPASISKLVIEIDKLNRNSEVGFRRRNLPALLYKYFSDMSLVFGGMIELLKKGASAFIVVGNNHTFAGGRRIEIKTIQLLTELAEEQGFETVDQLSMEMLTSRDIFRKNAIESESILHFRKPYQ